MNRDVVSFRCPPIGNDRVSSVRAAIERWNRSPTLFKLIEAFGTTIPNEPNLDAMVAWLLQFSERWDFRKLQHDAKANDIGEGARWLLDDSQLTQHQRDLIQECAVNLGLIGVAKPERQLYDYVLVLGGARLSCLLRPRFAAQLISSRHIQTKSVILLASDRPVAKSERDATESYAPNATTEFELVHAGAVEAFQVSEFQDERRDNANSPNSSSVIRRYETQKKLPSVMTISAPSSEPDKRRANSADTYQFLLSSFNIPLGASLLLVSSQIYVPYQQLEAIRTIALPYNLMVETVGFPPDWGGTLQGMVGPTNYLQEIRSTIQSSSRFLKSFPYYK